MAAGGPKIEPMSLCISACRRSGSIVLLFFLSSALPGEDLDGERFCGEEAGEECSRDEVGSWRSIRVTKVSGSLEGSSGMKYQAQEGSQASSSA